MWTSVRVLDMSDTGRVAFCWLADFVLITHAAFAAFVIFGLVLTLVGGYLSWSWVLNFWFRVLHLLGITTIVVQSWLGAICPLTTLEMWLRQHAGMSTYGGGFIQYWLHKLLFYDAPAQFFVAIYSFFGVLVVLAMFKYPPNLWYKRF